MRVSDIVLWDGITDPRPTEVWTPVASFESEYLVSSAGRLLRIAGGPGTRIRKGETCRLKALPPNSKGYVTVNLYKDGARRTAKLHVLMLETFIGPAPKDKFGKYEGHHINGKLLDNWIGNLAWKTGKDNLEDQWHRFITKGEVVW